jgi:hypothetical protein
VVCSSCPCYDVAPGVRVGFSFLRPLVSSRSALRVHVSSAWQVYRSLQHTRKVTQARSNLRVRRKATNAMLTPVLGFHRDKDFDHMRPSSVSDADLGPPGEEGQKSVPPEDHSGGEDSMRNRAHTVAVLRRRAVDLHGAGLAIKRGVDEGDSTSSPGVGSEGEVRAALGEPSSASVDMTARPVPVDDASKDVTLWTSNPLIRLEVEGFGPKSVRRGGVRPPGFVGPVPHSLSSFKAVQLNALVLPPRHGSDGADGASPAESGVEVSVPSPGTPPGSPSTRQIPALTSRQSSRVLLSRVRLLDAQRGSPLGPPSPSLGAHDSEGSVEGLAAPPTTPSDMHPGVEVGTVEGPGAGNPSSATTVPSW